MKIFQRLCGLLCAPTPDARLRSGAYIARKKPVELLATPVTQAHSVDTWEGARQAFVGDYLMTGIKGEHWPVAGAKFSTLYETLEQHPDGSLKVRKRVINLAVYQIYKALIFRAGGENFHAQHGDFIIAQDDSNCYPCAPDVFFETFEIVRPARADEQPNFFI
jgi:hypothetical protein